MFCSSLGLPNSTDLVSVLSTPIRGFEELAVFDRHKARIVTDSYVDEFRVKWEDVPQERREAFVAAHTEKDVHTLSCSNCILDNLKEIGWYDEYMLLSYGQKKVFRALGAVKQPTPLNDRIWSKIKPGIVAFLENHKRERLAIVKANALRIQFRKLNDLLQDEAPSSRIFAPLEYVALKPEVRVLLDVSHDKPLPVIEFESIRPLLAGWNALWIEEVSTQLRNAVRKAVYVPEPGTRDLLSLAIGAIWRCSQCKLNIPYPDALAHRCHWNPFCDDCNVNGHEDQYLQALHRYEQQPMGPKRSWNKLQTTAHLVKGMLDVYELDPFVSAAYLDSPRTTLALGSLVGFKPPKENA
ncbi:hypothetical protein EIP86_009751 [Pleurotus ostreatoroseus]|nr:hypothetical protein EIP86_009751 [Pleurotus ostreatoroseus]